MRNQQQGGGLEDNVGPVGAAADARPHINQHNHFFHFDGKTVLHRSKEKFTYRNWLISDHIYCDIFSINHAYML